MRKIITQSRFFHPPSIREFGFGVATFNFAPGKHVSEKVPGLSAYSPLRALPAGRKS